MKTAIAEKHLQNASFSESDKPLGHNEFWILKH
jgi:hypothetical protein